MSLHDVDTATGLRAWAKGLYPLEAAVELLIRFQDGRFARRGQPWIVELDDGQLYRVDADAIAPNLGSLSGGERRFLSVVTNLVDGPNPDTDTRVNLEDVATGVDRDALALILAAIAHAGGSHEHSRPVFGTDRTRIEGFDQPGSLFPWPESD